MAFIAEQAEGQRHRRRASASSTSSRAELHQRTPLVIGSREDVGFVADTDPPGGRARASGAASHSRRCEDGLRPGGLGRRSRPGISGRPASFRSPAACTRTCTPAGSGPCASTPASGPRRRPTSASASCSPRGRWASRPRSICRPRWATTPTTRWRRAKSDASASRSTRSTIWPSCSARSRSTGSRPR